MFAPASLRPLYSSLHIVPSASPSSSRAQFVDGAAPGSALNTAAQLNAQLTSPHRQLSSRQDCSLTHHDRRCRATPRTRANAYE